ncbi:hypothetical protein COT93_00195 [Candidatus Falkowbacteria bacterium CG10_big_fil_rev_8_21_14_0_10_37_18]|uniref:Uncharacterized protein n=1 Tax=Candidatus Falkowbacteria bacterium CG10_big_fil_rev_8_21_14_0_10_37_18 TaxID=1974562 RepID=A0A2H0V9T4_9BACT|nr:MAG: hypothetical protein COT93_00195 [Candidatus Falkowbacteria bacterium CG10_big_fil_rev_8_21_14_0_10_37_18]
MDATEIIGKISGILVLLSAIPYAWRVFQGKIKPNIVGWSLWSFIGLSILLNYQNIGAEDNIWPAIFSFTNPLIITLLAIWKKGEKIKLNRIEYFCAFFSIASIILWWYWLGNNNYSQYALYIAIIADAFAAIPTAIYVLKNPGGDRPFMWLIFAIGYGLAMLSIKEHNLANYSLPVYMCIMAIIVSIPLIKYRLKFKIPFKSWI